MQLVFASNNQNKVKEIQQMLPESITILSLEDIFDICQAKYKEHVVYSRVIFEYDSLEKNYSIMDLNSPWLTDVQKEFLNDFIKEKTPTLNEKAFLKFYQEDGLRHLIKNIEYWLTSNFKDIIV